VKTNSSYSNVADDWVPPCGPIRRKKKGSRKRVSSIDALKSDPNISDANLTAHWYGKKINGNFWVPSKRGADSDTMRAIASTEFPMSAVEYRDADIFACGVLPSQYAPPKREALEQLHPADLVDSEHPNSLVKAALKSEGKEVPPWDGTVKNNVGQLIWRIRESVK